MSISKKCLLILVIGFYLGELTAIEAAHHYSVEDRTAGCQKPIQGPPGPPGPPALEAAYANANQRSAIALTPPITPVPFDTDTVPPVGITRPSVTQFQVDSEGIYLIGWELVLQSTSSPDERHDIEVILRNATTDDILERTIETVVGSFTRDSVSGGVIAHLAANDIVELRLFNGSVENIVFNQNFFIVKVAN